MCWCEKEEDVLVDERRPCCRQSSRYDLQDHICRGLVLYFATHRTQTRKSHEKRWVSLPSICSPIRICWTHWRRISPEGSSTDDPPGNVAGHLAYRVEHMRTPPNCPQCGRPMELTGGSGNFWYCPRCKRSIPIRGAFLRTRTELSLWHVMP